MNRRQAPQGEKALSLLLDLGDLHHSLQSAMADYLTAVFLYACFVKSYLFGRRNTATVILVVCNISKATNISIINIVSSGLEPSRFLDVFEILRFPRSAQNSPGTPSLNR